MVWEADFSLLIDIYITQTMHCGSKSFFSKIVAFTNVAFHSPNIVLSETLLSSGI